MISADQHLNLTQSEISAFCRQHRIQRLAIFGSALRGDVSPDSDIDLLVEFKPDATPSLFDVGGMMADLTDQAGRQVDLRTPDDLSPYFRDRVLAEAAVVYDARPVHDAGG